MTLRERQHASRSSHALVGQNPIQMGPIHPMAREDRGRHATKDRGLKAKAVGRRCHLTGARGEHLVKDEASALVKDAHAWA